MPKRKTKCSTMRERSCIDGVLSHERSWSELPEDILHLLSKKLYDISDFIRFRAVCKSWQLSAPVTDAPPQLPWLLELPHEKLRENNIIRFYCLSSGKVHTLTCPALGHAQLYGPGCRYLLAYHLGNYEWSLLNPLTRDQIHLPDIINVRAFVPDYIGPDPIEGGDIVVMSISINMMVFWRPKADNWVYVEVVGDWYSGNAYSMGQYFSCDRETGITDVIDIATKKMAYQIAPEGTNPLLVGSRIMVESGGKILRLFHHFMSKPCHFDIYCLHFSDGERKPCWVKITDIGDQMLFLQYDRGLSLCASNFAGFKGNCIYFLKDGHPFRYNIGDGTTEVLPCPFVSVATRFAWFVPSLV